MRLSESGAPRLIDRAVVVYLFGFFCFFPLSGVLRGGPIPKLVVGSAIAAAAWDMLARWARPRIGGAELVLLAYGLWYVFAVAASPYPTLAKPTMITVLGWPVVLVAMAQMLCSSRRVHAALVGYVVGCAGAGVWALTTMVTGQAPTAQIIGQDVNDTGFFTSTGAVLAVGLWASRKLPSRLRLLCALCGLTSALAVGGSLSRGSSLGLAAGLALLFVVSPYSRWPLARGAALTLVLALLTIPIWLPRFLGGTKIKGHVAGENVSSRLDAWGLGANLGVTHPIAGVGPATISPYLLEVDHTPPGAFVVAVAHNTAIEALYGTGVVGLGLLAVGMGMAMWSAFRTNRHAGGRAVVYGRSGAPAAVALVAGVICAMFTTQLFNPTLWLVAALALAGSAPPVPTLLRLRRPCLWTKPAQAADR